MPRSWSQLLARALAGVALVAAVLLGAPDSSARLRPYYVLTAGGAGHIAPRILFALDTSGSMTWRPSGDNCPYPQRNRARQCDCAWNECEDDTQPASASRIAGARAAIRQVVQSMEGAADFALMSFGSVPPPQSAAEVPATCAGGARFAWVEQATSYAGRQDAYGPWGASAPPGHASAQRGTWALCGQNRPFPYMRADELGIAVPPSWDPEHPPAGPLFASWGGTWSEWTASSMAQRRVQWLPAFMGTHFTVPCAEVTSGDALSRSHGDYTAPELCGQEFFYVPFVDGFAGYASMTGYAGAGRVRMGVHERAFNLPGAADVCVQWNDACCEDHCQDNTDFQTCTEDCDTTGTPPPAPPPVPPGCGYFHDIHGRVASDGPHLSCTSNGYGPGTCTCNAGGLPSVDWAYPGPTEEAGCRLNNAQCIMDCEAHCASGRERDYYGTCVDCVDASCVLTCIDSHCDGGPLTGTHPGAETCDTVIDDCDYYLWPADQPVARDSDIPTCTSTWDGYAGLYTCYCNFGSTTLPPFTTPSPSCDRDPCITDCETACGAGCFWDVYGGHDCIDTSCAANCAVTSCGGGAVSGSPPPIPTCNGPAPPPACPPVAVSSCSSSGCPGPGCSCSCTLDGDTFDCGANYACWQTQLADCQTDCGFDHLGCARQRYAQNCAGGTDCQEVCEDRTEDCLATCSGANSCPVCEEWRSSGTGNASLLSPFWSQDAIDRYSGLAEGPASRDDAQNTVLGLTSHAIYGGIGAQAGTPWSTAIGDIPYLPTDPLPGGVNNAPYAHSTVASYLSLVAHPDLGGSGTCAPISLVVITDGEPSPSAEGGTDLYGRLSGLRTELGIDVYVVGFTLESSQLNAMACAAAGGGSTAPCNTTPPGGYDTCRDPNNPTTDCAYLASDPDELADVLRVILVDQTSTSVPAGSAASVNEFLDTANPQDKQALQTAIEGQTRMPGRTGHVARTACDQDDFPDLSAAEVDAICSTTAPLPIESDEAETFSSCSGGSCACDRFSRTWEAERCLAETPWEQRRLFTDRQLADGSHQLVRIVDPGGTIHPGFDAMLADATAQIPGLSDLTDANERQSFAGWLAGQGSASGPVLAGLGDASPVVVRRIPRRDPQFVPTVGVRDPHCSGRVLNPGADVPLSLRDWSDRVWDGANIVAPSGSLAAHREYQEAVLVGTDAGILHGFQLDSGNELFGFIPPFLLARAYRRFALGGNASPTGTEEDFGLSATVNHGWVYDGALSEWRHLAVVGMGAGGKAYMALDVSHMGRAAEPLEVLWTTEDAALAPVYRPLLGETWSRPALTYSFPGADPLLPGAEPRASLVFGSGYPDPAPSGPGQGRTVVLADALTGSIRERARVPTPSDATLRYEPDAAVVNDIAVATHCLNGMWGEMQEAYFADPMGGLYRWDLGLGPGLATLDHAADSGRAWASNLVGGIPTADPAFRFRACQGSGDSCAVDISGGKYESFVYGPAVAASGRFSDFAGDQRETNAFVVALASGALNDDSTDVARTNSDFHSSLYILVDDHSAGANEHGGFNVPNGGDLTGGVTDPAFFRIALSQITRTRTLVPYPGAAPVSETGTFARGTRPIRPPRITMVPATDRPDLTVLYFEFEVFEPGSLTCDPRLFDGTQWYADPGGTFRIVFRLTADDSTGFDLVAGSGASFTEPDGFAPGVSGPGLSMGTVTQLDDGDCSGSGCGLRPGAGFTPPCDDNNYGGSAADSFSIALSHRVLSDFTPVEGP